MYSLIIRQGKVIDGTGQPGAVMDIAVDSGEIVNIAPNIPKRAAAVIDAAGKIVCPGFIDIQNHSDAYWQLFENPQLDSLVAQGYTSILVGQCGASLAPLVSHNALGPLRQWHANSGVNINWTTFGEFTATMRQRSFGCNVASLVGFDMVKDDAGNKDKHGKLFEISLALLKDALHAGAFGVSYRLTHDLSTDQARKFKLIGELAARERGLFSIHIENESEGLISAVEHCADLASSVKVNLKISHFKVRGSANWHQFEHVLEVLETSRQRGAAVYFDVYPYDSTWQSLFHYLPKWVDNKDKSKVVNYLSKHIDDARGLVVASTANQLNFSGKTVAEIAKNLGLTSEQAIYEIFRTGGEEILLFNRDLNAQQVAELGFHPLSMVATDGGGFPLSAAGPQNLLVHPRCFGAAPLFLRSALDHPHISLEEAIRKLTSLPARVMGLAKRGELRPGNRADMVIFDPTSINSRASLQNPYQFPTGIDSVLVDGEIVAFKGKLTGAKPGRFLVKK